MGYFKEQDDPDLRDRVAIAIYGVQVRTARRSVDEYDFQLERMKRVFLLIDSESDRSIAILLFALCEDLMLISLKYYLRGKTKGGWDEATSGNGVLSTANDRIAILELLGWVRPELADNLRLMKSVRNRFAHHADVNDFVDAKIRGWLSSMSKSEQPVIDTLRNSDRSTDPSHSPRQLYLMRAVLTIVATVNDLAIMPAALAQQVSPGHVAGNGFDDMPEQLKELRLIAADVILRTCF